MCPQMSVVQQQNVQTRLLRRGEEKLTSYIISRRARELREAASECSGAES